MKKKWLAAGGIVIIIAFVVFGLITNSQQSDGQANEMETISLKEQRISETIIVPGSLKFNEEQTVYYQSDKGEIKEILVKEGDTVKKGDILISYRSESLLNEQKQNQIQINMNYLELDNIRKKHDEMDRKLKEDKENADLQTAHDDLKFQEQKKELE